MPSGSAQPTHRVPAALCGRAEEGRTTKAAAQARPNRAVHRGADAVGKRKTPGDCVYFHPQPPEGGRPWKAGAMPAFNSARGWRWAVGGPWGLSLTKKLGFPILALFQTSGTGYRGGGGVIARTNLTVHCLSGNPYPVSPGKWLWQIGEIRPSTEGCPILQGYWNPGPECPSGGRLRVRLGCNIGHGVHRSGGEGARGVTAVPSRSPGRRLARLVGT